jgi:DNA-binding NarL/FixJ family response regulator
MRRKGTSSVLPMESSRSRIEDPQSLTAALATGFAICSRGMPAPSPAPSNAPARVDSSDPRVDIALRHRILRANLRFQESQILIAAVDGVPRARLARELGIAENTIKTHMNTMLRKLGAVSMDAAVNDVLRAALEVSAP